LKILVSSTFCSFSRFSDGFPGLHEIPSREAVNAAAEHGNVSAARAKFQEILVRKLREKWEKRSRMFIVVHLPGGYIW
jgi:hypothetical protein